MSSGRPSLRVHALRRGKYEEIARSEVLPELDLDLFARFLEVEDQTEAVRRFQQALRQGAQKPRPLTRKRPARSKTARARKRL